MKSDSLKEILIQILSKLIGFNTDDDTGLDLLHLLSIENHHLHHHPSQPSSSSSSSSSSCLSDLLRVVSLAVNNQVPSPFLHFTSSNVFHKKILLPIVPATQVPPFKTGISISTWIQLTSSGDSPTLILFQYSYLKKTNNQNNKQSNTKYNNSTESLCVVTVFLRAVHKINSNTRDIETASIVV
jgi:hypothetical protein